MRDRILRSGKIYPPPPLTRENRIPVSIRSWILVEGNHHAIEVHDLSEHGFGGYSARAVPIGSEILVALPGQGERPAQVRWALCGQFGARFLRRNGNAGLERPQSRIAPVVHREA